jgi:hypothetical protein
MRRRFTMFLVRSRSQPLQGSLHFVPFVCSSFISLNELHSYLLPQGIALGQ